MLRLEVELERELNDSSSVLIRDLSKVVERVRIKRVTLSWVTNAVRTTQSIWNGDVLIASRVECQIDIAGTETTGGRNLTRICLVEDVEEARSELELLTFTEVEVLKERNVKVASAWSP